MPLPHFYQHQAGTIWANWSFKKKQKNKSTTKNLENVFNTDENTMYYEFH